MKQLTGRKGFLENIEWLIKNVDKNVIIPLISCLKINLKNNNPV